MNSKSALFSLALVGLVALFFLALPTPDAEGIAEATTVPGGHFAISSVRVFDGVDVIENATVVIRDGRVQSIGDSGELDGSIPVVDGAGKTLLPGLIDAHTHTWGEALSDATRFGVTTVLDMFTTTEFAAQGRLTRDGFGPKDEADLYSAGTLVTSKGGHGTEYGLPIPTLDDAADASAFVRQRVEEGSDYIKIVYDSGQAWNMNLPTIDRTTLRAVVRAAHDENRLAVVHTSSQAEARDALEAGADGLVHTFGDVEVDDEFLRLAKSSGAFVVSTVSLLAHMDRADDGEPFADDDRIAPYLSPVQKEGLRRRFPFSEHAASYGSKAIDNLRRMHEAGIPLLAGSDAPNPGTAHGVTLHEELTLMVEAGFTPVEALRAATTGPAKQFKLEGRGCIAVGCRADLVLVEGDPTSVIDDTRRIEAVWKNGHPVTRTRRDGPSEAHSSIEGEELVSDFDNGAIETGFGSGWMVTTDQIMNGSSTAEMTLAKGGAKGSAGSLRVDGEIGSGFPFPWSGAIFFPGASPMQPVDASSKHDLVFWIRTDQKELRVMAFAESLGSRPAEVSVPVSTDWTEVVVSLEKFPGFDPKALQGFAISAGPAGGDFWFEIDDVRLP